MSLGFTILGEIFAYIYVTVFSPTIEVVTFRLTLCDQMIDMTKTIAKLILNDMVRHIILHNTD